MIKSLFLKQVSIFIAIFTVMFLFFYGHYRYNDLGFDAQTLITWEYAAESGIVPYRDVFYPYGLVQYFYETSLVARLVILLVTTAYFYIIFLALCRLTRDHIFSIILLILFFLFVERFTGFLSFARYGSGLAFGLALALFSNEGGLKLQSRHFWLGLFAGLLGTLFLDQSFYCLIVYGLASFVIQLQEREKYKSLLSLVLQYFRLGCIFILGFILGLAPLILYMVSTHGQTQFIETLLHIPELTHYAKAPFFSQFRKPENIFITMSLLLSIGILCFRAFVERKKYFYEHIVVFTLFLVLLFASYKNVVRLIDKEIIPISLLVFIFILYLFKEQLLKIFLNQKYFKIYLVIFLSYCVVQPFFTIPAFRVRKIIPETVTQQLERLGVYDSIYQRVVDSLQSQSDFAGRVFSFPTDPIFYVLLKQQPPRYFQTYDASSKRAQQQQISFMQENEVEYVIYNMSVSAVQDGVPDYLRGNTTLRYILTQYEPITVIDHFLVLKKSDYPNFFSSVVAPSAIKNDLLNLNFGSVPLAEGIYKEDLVTELPLVIDIENTFAKDLIIKASCTTSTGQTVRLSTTDGFETILSFNCRKGKTVLLNLARVPLFFSERTISTIKTSSDLQEVSWLDGSQASTELW